jgi:exopolysaccharide production protein ExoQ
MAPSRLRVLGNRVLDHTGHDSNLALEAVLPKTWLILPFLLFSGLSIGWSVDWQISLSRWLILISSIAVAAYLGLHYDMKRIVKALSVFGALILLLSAVLVFLIPRIGVMNYHSIQGAWKGVFWHKNHMGMFAAFANTLFLTGAIGALQSRAKSIWGRGALYFFSLYFVFQTDSVGALLTLIVLHALILLSVGYLKIRKRLHPYHYMLLVVILIFVVVVLYANLDHIFSLFNRDTSLTGRVPMWGHLFATYLSQRPLGGYGFNAFWYVESHRVAMQQAAGYPDPIVIADNGFIDLLINTGYLGLALFMFFYLGFWARSVKYAWKAVDVYGLFPMIVMAYTLFANLSWSLLFENEGFFMLIMITLMFSLSARPEIGRAE